YLWATLAVFAGWEATDIRVSVDDEVRGGRMHDVIVANGRYFGGGMMICPDASPDDGRFDVLLLGDLTKRDLLLTLPKTYKGRHLPHPKAELLRGAPVTVDTDESLPMQLDESLLERVHRAQEAIGSRGVRERLDRVLACVGETGEEILLRGACAGHRVLLRSGRPDHNHTERSRLAPVSDALRLTRRQLV